MLRRLFQASLFAAVFIACGAPEPASGAGPRTRGFPRGRSPGPHRGPVQAGPHRSGFPPGPGTRARGVFLRAAAGRRRRALHDREHVRDQRRGRAGRRRAGELRGDRPDGGGDREDHRPAHHPRRDLFRPRGPHGGECGVSGGGRVHRARELGGGDGGDPRADSGDPDAPNGDLGPIGSHARRARDGGALPGESPHRRRPGGPSAGGERALPHRGLSPPGVPGDAFGVSDRVGWPCCGGPRS